MTFTVSPNDPSIHVFSLSDGGLKLAHQTYLSPLTETSETAGATSVSDALGAQIDSIYAEVFAVRDVEPMGLRDYLSQAHDIPAETLARDAARLDGLSGDVLVLAPKALAGVTELSPRPELTHIGSYAPAEANNTPVDLPPAARNPSVADTPEAPTRAPLSGRTIATVAVLALVFAGLLVVLL